MSIWTLLLQQQEAQDSSPREHQAAPQGKRTGSGSNPTETVIYGCQTSCHISVDGSKPLACWDKKGILGKKKKKTKRKKWKYQGKSIFTWPWQSLRVATRGSSATSFPNIRKAAADTTWELHSTQLLLDKPPILIQNTTKRGSC